MVWRGRHVGQRPIAHDHRHSSAHLPERATAFSSEPVPQPAVGNRSRRPRHGGGSLKPVILADSRSPPQGWPLWLSADMFSSFTELEKIEKLPP